MVEKDHLGKALRKLREAHGIKQYEMAKLIHKSESAYNRIENGKTPISLTTYYTYTKHMSNHLVKKTGYMLDEEVAKGAYQKALDVLKRLFGEDEK